VKNSTRSFAHFVESVLILLPVIVIAGIAIFAFVRQVRAAQNGIEDAQFNYYFQSPIPTPTNTYTPIPVASPTNTYTPIPVASPTNTYTPIPVASPTNTYTPIPVASPTPTYTPIPPVYTQPEIVSLEPLGDPVIEVNETVIFQAELAEIGPGESFTAVWDWGDGTTTTQLVVTPVFTDPQVFLSSGVFTVNLLVSNSAGDSDSQSYEYVVVTDPGSGAFLTGTGEIDSQEGAYYPDPTVSGPAKFGFYARQDTQTSTTECKIQFNLPAAALDFQSQVCAWLVISGDRAYLFGHGTINGQGNYAVYLTAVDGGNTLTQNDRLRIKIWNTAGGSETIYDNMLPGNGLDRYQLIQDGKIKIHH